MFNPVTWLRGRPAADLALPVVPVVPENEPPLPFLHFNLDQLEAYARLSAAGCVVSRQQGADRLLPRLSVNQARLRVGCAQLAAAQRTRLPISPAGEWLLDNQHLIEEQGMLARRHLPKGYSRGLPHIVGGPMAGHARVYVLALEVIAHVDGRVDAENLARFVGAWQEVAPLTLGELWAIPIMLRLALLENLGRVSTRVEVGMVHRALARAWTQRIVAAAEQDPKALLLAVADMARADPPLSNAFVAELVRRLQERGGLVDIPLTWIEHQLAERGTSIQNRVQAESGDQAANQVSVSSSIGSLRFLNTMVWRDFVEGQSRVEATLREDPAGVYAKMDFRTRDRYRHVVEDLGRESGTPEPEVAALAVALARAGAATADGDARATHVGYYLIDRGQPALLAALPGLPTLVRLRRTHRRRAWPIVYFLVLFVVTFAATAAAALVFPGVGLGWRVLLAPLLITAASQLGALAANWLATTFHEPAVLPRLDVAEVIPEDCRTLVVVPTLLTELGKVDALLEGLEVRYLGNRGANLSFGLLTDFGDAPSAERVGDDALVDALADGIEALNRRYPEGRFYLLHRPREWNEQERMWMGYERKRGKLEALNNVLRGRGANEAAFARIVGDLGTLRQTAFVITLDTDTRLPRDAGRELIGALAHPLNRPRYDAALQRITEGYAILQPRVAIHLPSARRSWFVRIFAGEAGTDPYTLAVSDVYQDLFGEGSFVGKGIYDVDAFIAALDGQLPDNLILSHDLIEGCFARSGLVSDVLLYEDHPSHLLDDGARRRRWTRGDWQILYWVLPRAPGREGTWRRNPLTALSRWKIIDNLRRSMVPLATVGATLVGLVSLADTRVVVAAVLVLTFLAPLLATLGGLARRAPEVGIVAHVRFELRAAVGRAVHATIGLMLMPEDCRNSLDAIARSAVRMFFTHRNLLEWRTGAPPARGGLRQFVQAMGAGPLLALAVVIARLVQGYGPLDPALFLLLPWAASPAVAAWLSADREERPAPFHAADAAWLRRLARRTWRWFETFVGEEDHWLPPDNIQEQPILTVAHRTSPTNIGLALLANLAAHDFGYLSTSALFERTRHTVATLTRLERFRGHFYNWYDTRTLAPLAPAYISTVDSGNLMGHLLVLESGLRGIGATPIVSERACEALGDTLDILIGLSPGRAAPLAALRRAARATPDTLRAAWELARVVDAALPGLRATHSGEDTLASGWAITLARQAEDTILAPVVRFTCFTKDGALPDEGATIPTLDALAAGDGPGSAGARALLAEVGPLVAVVEALGQMELDFLYDSARHLFTIGYNVAERRRDVGCYDLLASESRLISYLAVARGAVPQEHWFALGRLVTTWRGAPALLSWSGSMFEYLMPTLVMPTFPGTLLDETCRTVVARQVEQGARLGIPWGVSESGYNLTDDHLNYQYKAFGVPGLGLQRGLAEEQVVAPYATVMALMVAPAVACANLRRMAAVGFEGRYGFYEAIDYTPRRQGVGQRFALIRSHMAHHQGMSLLALAYALLDRPMQRRFRAHPELLATELLLQERVPRQAALYPHAREATEGEAPQVAPVPSLFVVPTADTPRPEVHLLSNGAYSVMVTNAGGGYSRWNDLLLTRWREDPTADDWGTFIYVRDVEDDARWSAAWQPTCATGDHYEAIFPPSRAEFRRRDCGIELHTEVTVSAEDDIELRRVTLTNLSPRSRTIELTTYAEVVLAPAAADETHPAFANLFVQTEILTDRQAILCTRRPRTETEHPPVLFHRMTVHGDTDEALHFETDRRTFIGRGHTAASPAGIMRGTDGSVLDPIVAIRCRITLAPEQSFSLHVVTGVAPTRDEALVLVDRYRDRRMGDRVFELAWTHRQVLMRQAGITDAEAELYLRMASPIVYADPLRRASTAVLSRNRRGQSSLWAYGISGDLPIVLLRVASLESIELVRQVVRAHTWWRGLGLAVDLVIWDETEDGYHHTLRDQILAVISNGSGTALLDVPGGIFLRRLDVFADEDRVLVETLARFLLTGGGGTLAEQLAHRLPRVALVPRLEPRSPPTEASPPEAVVPDGFVDGAYQITTTPTRRTPAPWSNILSNPHFGALVTESGGGYTWCENAHEFRVTPWSNDPVGDRCGEAYYIRDDATGQVWSPTPKPAGASTPYITHHQFGATTFTHTSFGVRSELTMFVATDAPVKIVLLKLTNLTDRARTLSVTGYVEWVLGELRSRSLLHVNTEVDPTSGALLARNAFHPEFGARIGFFDVSERRRTVTGDRTEFLGRNGTLARPAALSRERLSGRVGAGLDACAALMAPVDLGPHATHEVCFVLGVGREVHDVRTLLHRFGRAPEAAQALQAVHRHWATALGGIRIETPEPGLDVLVNGWLPYQVIACRMWARTGLYQSGGAFGFRDQLQDAMALLHIRPEMLRAQIVLCAGRQYRDGDVQHWWHPPSGRGVRTHCSDDLLWLPLAVARYVRGVGDTGVLDVRAPYLEGRQVKPSEEAYGDLPHPSEEKGTVYEHCMRAIERALRFGAHGLPLMGSGDWNDGMNLVGARGRGESVWLGFFLYDVLVRFAVVAERVNDHGFAARCRREAMALAERIEASAWDGAWYRRAWFDDGEVLGSTANTECRIDSIPQAWAVFSGAGSGERARLAMSAVDEHLVDRDVGVIKLFAPPFDTSEPNPGYIRGYVPGVRENGGQYTHAALWAAMAFAQLGDWRRAWELTRMLNPASHTGTDTHRAQYRVEPYVMAADVYAVAPHAGMGGWTWHTGSAGWMVRLVLESLLGLRVDVDRLSFTPCVPPAWEGFRVSYRFRRSTYTIAARPGETPSVTLDGARLDTPYVPLVDDERVHVVGVVYARVPPPGGAGA